MQKSEEVKNINSEIKKILFIQSVPCIRTNKVAKALHEKGIQVDLVYLEVHPSEVYKDLELPYTNMYKLQNANEMVELINKSDYDVLYSSNEPDYLTVLFTVTNKPIVHDTHDMMSLRADITNEQLILEYIANIKSTGNIYVNPLIKEIAIQKFDIKNKPILTLHSFIEQEQLPNKYYEKLSSIDGEIHCVFEGGLQGVVGHHRFLEPIFLKLVEHQIHVHLHCPADHKYIETLIKKSKYIHYEEVTSPKNLILEMTKYDIGLAIFNITERNKTFLDTAFPNKIWDYLAAGLPILFADLLSFRQFAEQSCVGKVLDLNGDIKEQAEQVHKIKIDKDLLKKKKWIMNEAVEEIIDFLTKVKKDYYCGNNAREQKTKVEDRNYFNTIIDIRNIYSEFKNRQKKMEFNEKNKMKCEMDFGSNSNSNMKNITDIKDSKILFGPSDIANQLNLYSKELRKKGFQATNLSYFKKIFDFQIDKFIDISKYGGYNEQLKKTKEIASEMTSQYDVFHFMYGRSLALDHSDLPLYKKFDKKVIMSFMGDDVRRYSEAVKLNPYWELIKDDYFEKLGLLNEENTKRHIEFLGKYITDCFVDYELYEYVKDYFQNIHYARIAVDISSIPLIIENKNFKPIIIHAPSSYEGKGTKFIVKAIDELKEKYDFDFILIQNMKHEDAMKIYEKADIVIDQIICGSYGTFAVEAMAMGKSVICWISDFMKERYPKELPIIRANPDDIKEKIELLIKDYELRKELGIRGRQYAEKYHDVSEVVKNFIDVYKNI